MNAIDGDAIEDTIASKREMQTILARELSDEFASVLRRMEAFDGNGERAASAFLSTMPDSKAMGDRLASIGFSFGAGVDHSFASWQLRSEPDEDDPEGEVQKDAALAIMMLNEAVYTCPRRTDGGTTAGTTLFVACSDVFAWACSDLEEMRHDQIAEVFGFWEKDPRWGTAVWCMIQRRELPQRPVLQRMRETGIWDVDALTTQHGLRANHYDGVSAVHARRRRDAYERWCRSTEREPVPFDGGWWAEWRGFVEANPDWYDEAWRSGDAAARDAWRIENGFVDETASGIGVDGLESSEDPCAAVGGRDRPDMPNAMRLKLDMRIHRQRLALRRDWQIVEQRRRSRPGHNHNRFLEATLKVLRENDALRSRIAELEKRPQTDATEEP